MSGLVDVLLVALGGGVGAAARFWVADTVRARRPSGFPWGTWTVNVVGSFVVGLLAGWVLAGWSPAGEHWRLLLAVGLCGGFTTFSTASVETATLLQAGRVRLAVLHALSTLVVSVAAVAAGLTVVTLLPLAR
ncbi:fluoride efflux transporter CrcB [Isoptericola variabilis]|uniref:Fluoride-specific ion channel FluC n=1 Tax=Isoptericola variabilis (strain 225) TaxID=743718 RepID=F6FW42_ISOV2|nr:fluoride efflux transporter CrcB [Isoptericola variabilis]AEG45586.1 CrcB-like protein [Isoptericola variabilis 225]TWH25806.1 CrcB protein [Isoptericola variabilis J7]